MAILDREIRRSVVLGAGASNSYDQSPTGVRPPLARELISAFHKLDISANRHVLIGSIINYVRDTRGVPPAKFHLWAEDAEVLLSEIDDMISSLTTAAAGKDVSRSPDFENAMLSTGAYSQLVLLFASILNEIQNWPNSVSYSHLVSELKQTDAVISFNWDTLLDRALYASGRWSPNDGYLIQPEAIFDDGWRARDTVARSETAPLYLKVHGSTNWITPLEVFSIHDGLKKQSLNSSGTEKLYIYQNASRPYETYKNRCWGPYQPFSYCYYPPNLPCNADQPPPGFCRVSTTCTPDLPGHGDTIVNDPSVYGMPLIVPPVKNKDYRRYGKLFGTLWTSAAEALSVSEEIFLIGYSFPHTDIRTITMFKEALANNGNLRRVVIINPLPESVITAIIRDFAIDPNIVEVREEFFGQTTKLT